MSSVWKTSHSQSQISQITLYCESQVYCNSVSYVLVLVFCLMYNPSLSCYISNKPFFIFFHFSRDHGMVCIGCTSVVQCERTVVLRSAEMRNFSAAECGKATWGNLRNVPHLVFHTLPLDNVLHSAEYVRPGLWPAHLFAKTLLRFLVYHFTMTSVSVHNILILPEFTSSHFKCLFGVCSILCGRRPWCVCTTAKLN